MQSRLQSLTESTLNTLSGFLLSLFTSAVIYPLYGWTPSWTQMTSLTVIFTVISIARSYLWRRFFNKREAA